VWRALSAATEHRRAPRRRPAKTHVSRVLAKLGCTSRVQAGILAKTVCRLGLFNFKVIR
jgi:hypothetical protein